MNWYLEKFFEENPDAPKLRTRGPVQRLPAYNDGQLLWKSVSVTKVADGWRVRSPLYKRVVFLSEHSAWKAAMEV